MYTCVRALLRPRGENERLAEEQVAGALLRSLVTDYSFCQLVLTHPAVPHEISLNVNDVLDKIYSTRPDVTVEDWLESLGEQSLPTSDLVLKKEVGVAKYNDAFAAGYHLELVHPLAGAGSQLPDIEKTDLLLTRKGVSYEDFFKYCLVTVNGLFHLTDYSSAGVKVRDAGRSIQKANRHNVGIYSFRDVGEVSCYPIKDENIYPLQAGLPLNKGLLINVPEVDLSSKVVLLSIGGVLHFLNQYYKVVGDHTVLVEYDKLPLTHRYMDTRKKINLQPYLETMTINPNHAGALDLNQASKDVSIKAYLTLPQSFVICIEAENFFVEKHQLERTGLANRYYSYERPTLPMQLENGLFAEYLAHAEDGMYSIMVEDNLIDRPLSDTRPITDDNYFPLHRISSNPAYYASAYMLEMGTETLETP